MVRLMENGTDLRIIQELYFNSSMVRLMVNVVQLALQI